MQYLGYAYIKNDLSFIWNSNLTPCSVFYLLNLATLVIVTFRLPVVFPKGVLQFCLMVIGNQYTFQEVDLPQKTYT